MIHGASFTIQKQNGKRMNVNLHHQLETKRKILSVGVKGKVMLEVYFLTARSL
jgi:hypothetical protein